jgi:membrane protein CcdC involved in cytochrome C biogenesis
MKGTIMMLSFIVTTIGIWLLFAGIKYFVSSDLTFQQAAGSNAVLFFMIVIGWLPGIVVCNDIDNKL